MAGVLVGVVAVTGRGVFHSAGRAGPMCRVVPLPAQFRGFRGDRATAIVADLHGVAVIALVGELRRPYRVIGMPGTAAPYTSAARCRSSRRPVRPPAESMLSLRRRSNSRPALPDR